MQVDDVQGQYEHVMSLNKIRLDYNNDLANFSKTARAKLGKFYKAPHC